MSDLEIREARAGEMEVVRELFLEYAKSLDLDLSFQHFDEELAALPGQYAPPGGCLLLAFWKDTLAGCVAMRPLDEGRCEMKRLYVREAYRGYGVGKALMMCFLQRARDFHYQSVTLDSIQPLMSKAISMYKGFGFREIPPYRPNPVRGAVYLELQL